MNIWIIKIPVLPVECILAMYRWMRKNEIIVAFRGRIMLTSQLSFIASIVYAPTLRIMSLTSPCAEKPKESTQKPTLVASLIQNLDPSACMSCSILQEPPLSDVVPDLVAILSAQTSSIKKKEAAMNELYDLTYQNDENRYVCTLFAHQLCVLVLDSLTD